MQTTTWQLMLEASFVVKLVLVILAGFSIMSWGLILYKFLTLRSASDQSVAFLSAFASGKSMTELVEAARSLPDSPVARVFEAAHPSRRAAAAGERRLRQAGLIETERLQSYLPVLATTGSVTPFIGLLGTVWGIMDAFRGIGQAGSASLAVVSPAIAEALVTTAAGLFAAIPAVIAYNAFLNWIRKLVVELEAFVDQLGAQEAGASSP